MCQLLEFNLDKVWSVVWESAGVQVPNAVHAQNVRIIKKLSSACWFNPDLTSISDDSAKPQIMFKCTSYIEFYPHIATMLLCGLL